MASTAEVKVEEKAPEKKTEKKGHGKNLWFETEKFDRYKTFRKKFRVAAAKNFHQDPRAHNAAASQYDDKAAEAEGDNDEFNLHAYIKWVGQESIKAKDGTFENALPDDLGGIMVRETGWIKANPDYEVFALGISLRDWGIMTGLLMVLYMIYVAIFCFTLFLFNNGGATYLWVCLGLLLLFMFFIMLCVGHGYMNENRKEAERLRQEATEKAAEEEARKKMAKEKRMAKEGK